MGFHQICFVDVERAIPFGGQQDLEHQLHKTERGRSWSGHQGTLEHCDSWEHRCCKKSTEEGSALTRMFFLFHLGRTRPSWFARPTSKYFLVDIDLLIILRGTQCKAKTSLLIRSRISTGGTRERRCSALVLGTNTFSCFIASRG